MGFDRPRERPEQPRRPLDDPYRDLEGLSPFHRAVRAAGQSPFLDRLMAEASGQFQIDEDTATDITYVRAFERMSELGSETGRAGADEQLSRIARGAGASALATEYHERAVRRAGSDGFRLTLFAEAAMWSADISLESGYQRQRMEKQREWCLDAQRIVVEGGPGSQRTALELSRVHSREGRNGYAHWSMRRAASLAHAMGDAETFAVAASAVAEVSPLYSPGAPALKGDVTAPVPTGWTYLIHGTDTGRSWDPNAETVKVSPELSAITLEDKARNQQLSENIRAQGIATSGYDTTRTYSKPRSPGTEAIEFRVVFPREDLSSRRRALPDAAGLAASLDPETRRLVTRYHQDRHAVVPRGETLVRLGEGQSNDGRRVIYYVPEKVAELYATALDSAMGGGSQQVTRAAQIGQEAMAARAIA